MKYNLLIVDDDNLVCRTINNILKSNNYNIDSVDSGFAALESIKTHKPDLILLDINMQDLNGIDVLKRVKKKYPDVIVIIITGFATIESAIEAMKAGAYDYIQKPFAPAQLQILVKNALETLKLKKEVEELRQWQFRKNNFDKIIGNSDEMQQALSLVKSFAPSNASIIIEGKSGTGKELVAEFIHFLSPRYAKPYVVFNCGAVHKELLESELFGYESGAFTGASSKGKRGLLDEANSGTLFLDEVSEMPLEAQVKFLRVLENGEFYRLGSPFVQKVDLRVIAASNTSLEQAIKDGRFREDLYYRLNIAKIILPSLCDRKLDIIPLAKYFIDHFNVQFGKQVKGISADAKDLLLSHSYHGNVRELKNIIERVMLLTQKNIIVLEDIELAGISAQENSLNILVKLNTSSTHNVLHKFSSDIIKKTLEISRNNKTHAAKLLGIPRSTLRYYLKRC